jgi:hypothetical protein
VRGDDRHQERMFSYISPEARVPQDHPLRGIRDLVDEVLHQLSPTLPDSIRGLVDLRFRRRCCCARCCCRFSIRCAMKPS